MNGLTLLTLLSATPALSYNPNTASPKGTVVTIIASWPLFTSLDHNRRHHLHHHRHYYF